MQAAAEELVPPPPSEFELWRRQNVTAAAALDFAISFLGCRMGPSNDRPLTTDARNRLLDILRAVSVVESRHGTQGAHQPARDPIQCGNPRDSWWREVTGQSGRGSRFIRGPGLTNLWADQVAAEAERAPGFDRAASMTRLADRAHGHNDAAFAAAHSYFWGALYLVHRINTTAGSASFACGDLSRARLIEGAVAYNGGGVADYEERILDALAEFGGLSALFDTRVRAAPVTQAEPEPAGGLQPMAAIAIMVIGAAAALLVGWWRYGGFTYVDDFTTEAPRVVTTLTVIALFMERALAALSTAWLGTEREQARARLLAAEKAARTDPRSLSELRAGLRAAAAVAARQDRLRVTVGFLIGLAVSGAGVRTLASLVELGVAPAPSAAGELLEGGQLALFNSVDIVLTAGLLAGGSEALAGLAELIRAAVDATVARFRLSMRSR